MDVTDAVSYAFAAGTDGAGTYGDLTLNADGSYSYTLDTEFDTDPATNDGTNVELAAEVFNYTATDADGNTVDGTITVDIKDDIPTAVADTDSVAEGDSTSGNVLTDGVDDEFGADGAAATTPAGGVVGVAFSSDTSTHVSGDLGGTGIDGDHGTLILNADGSYTYNADANAIAANDTDTFVYTIEDGDGDLSTTTLTINVNNVTLSPDNDTIEVDEAALDSVGSDPTSGAETTGGTLAVTGAVNYAFKAGTDGDGDYGTLTIVNAATGEYSYTLDTPYTTLPDTNDGAVVETGKDTFDYTATDINGNTVNGTITVDIKDDVPVFTLVNDGADSDSIVSIEAPNPDVDTTYDGQFADWNPGADGFKDANLTLPDNVDLVSKDADQIVLNLMEGTDVAGTLTLNADGTDSLEVSHRDSETQFLPISNTSADAGGPTDVYLVDLADAADFNINVTADDGVSPSNDPANDAVNTSTQGWGVKGNSGQTVDGGESLLFTFVNDSDNTTGYGVEDFRFQASGFTGGMGPGAEIDIVVWLNAAGTLTDTISIEAPKDQVVRISEITTDFGVSWTGTGGYTSGDSIYAVEITSNELDGGGFRINGIEVGEQTEILPDDLNFNNIIVEIEDGDGDTVAQAFSVHIDGEDPYSGELVVEIAPQLGGPGDDSLTFDSAYNHIDGKDGYDTLLVDDTGALDFSSVHNVEKLDLNDDTSAQTVELTMQDVFDMTGDGNLTAGVPTLELSGDSTDTVKIDTTGWTEDGSTSGLFTNNDGSGDSIMISLASDADANFSVVDHNDADIDI